MKIWEAIRDFYPPCLKDAALVLTSLPPTQVSVERLFSALKILKSDRRSRLSEDILDAMLFLRTNTFSKF